MSPERRRQVLLAVLVVSAAVLALRLAGGAGGGDGLAGFGFSGGAPAAGEALRGTVAEVRLDRLERERAQYTPGRDPFRFQAAQPKAPPPPPPRPRPQAQRQAPPPRPQPAPTRPAGPQPPSIDFVFLGSFGPNDRKIGVFTDRTDIYNARIGDVIKQGFVVVEIGYESADVGFVGFPEVPAQRLAAGG